MYKYLLFILIFIVSCIPPSEEVYYEVSVDYKDPGVRKILDLQNKQDLDSLLLMLGDPNPTYRYFASRAFASFINEAAEDSLINLLDDSFIEVRAAAAFALVRD